MPSSAIRQAPQYMAVDRATQADCFSARNHRGVTRMVVIRKGVTSDPCLVIGPDRDTVLGRSRGAIGIRRLWDMRFTHDFLTNQPANPRQRAPKTGYPIRKARLEPGSKLARNPYPQKAAISSNKVARP